MLFLNLYLWEIDFMVIACILNLFCGKNTLFIARMSQSFQQPIILEARALAFLKGIGCQCL